ncbi:MAG: hypothetical protein SO355_06800 [Candidatus Faecousia sp.]|nr:hypothetical protein [Candidatus Faecousia sp.]
MSQDMPVFPALEQKGEKLTENVENHQKSSKIIDTKGTKSGKTTKKEEIIL